MDSKGYVGLFSTPLTSDHIRQCVKSWLNRFEKVEQVCPGTTAGSITIAINQPGDLIEDAHPQFRVLNGTDFTWIYITRDRFVIETSGFAQEDITLCLDVLMELPNLVEIIDEHNDNRLDQLEAEGLM